MKKRGLITPALLASATFFLAQFAANAEATTEMQFELDGITYNVTDGKNATVNQTPRDIEEIHIPAHVVWEGVSYRVVALGDQCAQWSQLKSITLPETLEKIGRDAFSQCQNLKSIELPESVKEIGASAFSESGLESFKNPSSNTMLEQYVFSGCKALKEIDLTGVKIISHGAFGGCESLTGITLPRSLTLIGRDAFVGCPLDYVGFLQESMCPITSIESNFGQENLTAFLAPAWGFIGGVVSYVSYIPEAYENKATFNPAKGCEVSFSCAALPGMREPRPLTSVYSLQIMAKDEPAAETDKESESNGTIRSLLHPLTFHLDVSEYSAEQQEMLHVYYLGEDITERVDEDWCVTIDKALVADKINPVRPDISIPVNQLEVRLSSGIESIGLDGKDLSAPVEIFTLQGIKVGSFDRNEDWEHSLPAGIYIKTEGNLRSKVMVK